jgi:hypothetical protein
MHFDFFTPSSPIAFTFLLLLELDKKISHTELNMLAMIIPPHGDENCSTVVAIFVHILGQVRLFFRFLMNQISFKTKQSLT